MRYVVLLKGLMNKTKECLKSSCKTRRNKTNNMSDERIKKIAKHFGLGDTINQTIEEMSELIQALCKMNRMLNNDNSLRKTPEEVNKGVAEEMADVEICLLELKHLLQNWYEIEKIKQIKIERVGKLIEEHKGE